jgi:hypothetical protein
MKVKELIECLQKLDQERNIWVRYDGVYFYEPTIDDDNDRLRPHLCRGTLRNVEREILKI